MHGALHHNINERLGLCLCSLWLSVTMSSHSFILSGLDTEDWKKHLVVNEYSAVFQTVALNCKPQVLASIWFVEHGLLGWICITVLICSVRGHWGQHTFSDDLRRGSVHKPEIDDLMAYVRLSKHLQYLRYYMVRLHTTDTVYVHTLIWKRLWQILKYFSMS